MKLILIDDDCLVVSALKMILESEPDFEVTASADDGSAAPALYREHRPDVLLMDIRMKQKNGLEAAEEILQEFPSARILLLTTFSDDEYIIKALKLGAAGYLLKQDYHNIIPLSGQPPPARLYSARRSSPESRNLWELKKNQPTIKNTGSVNVNLM